MTTALLTATGRNRCQDVTTADLNGIWRLEISMGSTPLRSGDLADLTRLESIKFLGISGDMRSGSATYQSLGEEIKPLSRLRSLQISLAQSAGWPQSWASLLAGTPQLTDLKLAGTGSWENFSEQRLGPLPQLRRLSVEMTSVGRVDAASFSSYTNVESLELSLRVGSWEGQPLSQLGRLRSLGGTSTSGLHITRADACSFDAPPFAAMSHITFEQPTVELWDCRARRSVLARAPRATAFSPQFLEGLDWSAVTDLEFEAGSDRLINQLLALQDTWGRYVQNLSQLTLRLRRDVELDLTLLPELTKLRRINVFLPPQADISCWALRARIQQIYGFSSRSPWVNCQ